MTITETHVRREPQSLTHRVLPSRSSLPRVYLHTKNFSKVRSSVLEAGLPFIYVEKEENSGPFLRAPVSDFFLRGLRPSRSVQSLHEELGASESIWEDQSLVFLDVKDFFDCAPIGTLGSLAQHLPGTDIFLNTVLHWPSLAEKQCKGKRVVYTAALFQAGFFVPRHTEYSHFLLSDIFPKCQISTLRSALTESLNLTTLNPEHIAVAEALLDLGADPNALGEDGGIPLHEAIMHTNIPAIKLLLARGAKTVDDPYGEGTLDILRDHFDPADDSEMLSPFPGLTPNLKA